MEFFGYGDMPNKLPLTANATAYHELGTNTVVAVKVDNATLFVQNSKTMYKAMWAPWLLKIAGVASAPATFGGDIANEPDHSAVRCPRKTER